VPLTGFVALESTMLRDATLRVAPQHEVSLPKRDLLYWERSKTQLTAGGAPSR